MIKVKNLNLLFKGKYILKDVNFSVQDGEIVVITGSNGSGKTSLLKSIAGIFQKDTTGKIFFDQKDVSNLSISDRANCGLSFSFQEPITFKGITVKKLLEIAEKHSFNIDTACNHLSKVGLCARDYLNREFNKNLSGGEKKRIELALALARNTKNNLFDEPEAGIDMWSFDELTKLFLTLKNEQKTIIIVSHNKKIMEIADKIIILKNGTIEKIDTPKNVLRKMPDNLCAKLKGDAK